MSQTPDNNATALSIYPWQNQVWALLCQRLSDKQLPHAILLQGAPDSGTHQFAELFAHFLLCLTPENSRACGKCRDCLLIAARTHPGFIQVRPVENDEGKISKVIKIDQIREIIDFATHTSMQQGKKIILIYPAELMNINAANALLKNLEEPPANTQFLLVTNMPGKLLPTIRSRCQKVEVPLPSATEADQWLSTMLKNPTERKQLLALAMGNPLLVAQWQQDAVTGDIVNLRVELLSLLNGQASPMAVAKNWLGKGAEHLGWWSRWLLFEAKTPDSLALTQKELIDFMQKLLVAKRQLESAANPNEQLLLESLLIDWQLLK